MVHRSPSDHPTTGRVGRRLTGADGAGISVAAATAARAAAPPRAPRSGDGVGIRGGRGADAAKRGRPPARPPAVGHKEHPRRPRVGGACPPRQGAVWGGGAGGTRRLRCSGWMGDARHHLRARRPPQLPRRARPSCRDVPAPTSGDDGSGGSAATAQLPPPPTVRGGRGVAVMGEEGGGREGQAASAVVGRSRDRPRPLVSGGDKGDEGMGVWDVAGGQEVGVGGELVRAAGWEHGQVSASDGRGVCTVHTCKHMYFSHGRERRDTTKQKRQACSGGRPRPRWRRRPPPHQRAPSPCPSPPLTRGGSRPWRGAPPPPSPPRRAAAAAARPPACPRGPPGRPAPG